MDRFSVTARSAYSISVDADYFETNCVDDPVKMCDFQRTAGRILKTVDAVYQVRCFYYLFSDNVAGSTTSRYILPSTVYTTKRDGSIKNKKINRPFDPTGCGGRGSVQDPLPQLQLPLPFIRLRRHWR